MKSRTLFISAGVLVGALALASAVQEHVLRINVKSGDTFTYKSTSKTVMSISGMMESSSTTSEKSTRVMKVTGENEGWWKFEWSTKDVEIESDGGEMAPGMDMEQAAKVREDLVYKGEMSSRGQVRNITMVGGDPADPMTAMASGGTTTMLKDLGVMGFTLPEGALKVGDSWTVSYNIGKIIEEGSGGMVSASKPIQTTYKVESFENVNDKPHVVITAVSNDTIPVTSSMTGDGDLKVVSESKMWVELSNGILTKSTTNVDQTIDLGMVVVHMVINVSETR